LTDKNSDINFEIIPFDQFGYLYDLKKILQVNLQSQYEENHDDIFMYYYSEVSSKITLKFNIPTVFFENPIIELEFYNV
jgi:hypothetical protein